MIWNLDFYDLNIVVVRASGNWLVWTLHDPSLFTSFDPLSILLFLRSTFQVLPLEFVIFLCSSSSILLHSSFEFLHLPTKVPIHIIPTFGIHDEEKCWIVLAISRLHWNKEPKGWSIFNYLVFYFSPLSASSTHLHTPTWIVFQISFMSSLEKVSDYINGYQKGFDHPIDFS